jgi:hypothetical protein
MYHNVIFHGSQYKFLDPNQPERRMHIPANLSPVYYKHYFTNIIFPALDLQQSSARSSGF